MLLLTPDNWREYELIDCGDFEKQERFGEYITIRPEPQAVWDKGLTNREWDSMAHVRFLPSSSSSGSWTPSSRSRGRSVPLGLVLRKKTLIDDTKMGRCFEYGM